MVKEINEQPEALERVLSQDSDKVKNILNILRSASDIYFVACGTAGFASLLGAYYFSTIAGRKTQFVLASEFDSVSNLLNKDSVVVAVSQSGETADVLDAIELGKKKGAKTVALVNVLGSTLQRTVDSYALNHAGREICVLATKSYSNQVALMIILAYGLAGKYDEGKKMVEDVIPKVKEVIESCDESVRKVAKEIKGNRSMFIIGKDLLYPLAYEGALKIKEVSYIHVEGFAGGELKHGNIAVIEKGMPTIVLSSDATRNFIISNAAEIKARGGLIIGIDSQNNDVYDHFVQVPEVGLMNPLVMIIPLQLLAYYLAIEKGCDPDKPRNLAKSVTVR